LSALAKGTDRRVLGPEDCSTILWIMLVAETGAGKQHGVNCIRMLLRAMGVEQSYAAGGLGSVQGIEEILEGTTTIAGNESPLVVMDEVGAWLKRISSKGQSGNVSEIPALLQSLWGWSPEAPWVGSKTKGKEMTTVEGPAFSIYGVSTEKKLVGALTVEQIDNGFVNRFLFFNVGRGAPRPVDPRYRFTQMPGWLEAALKAKADWEPVGPIGKEGIIGLPAHWLGQRGKGTLA